MHTGEGIQNVVKPSLPDSHRDWETNLGHTWNRYDAAHEYEEGGWYEADNVLGETMS